MLTKWLFIGLIAVVILQRVFELNLSKRHAKYILEQGGREYGDNFLGAVKALQISWWVTMIAEVYVFERPFIPLLAAVALVAVLSGQVLRFLSMKALKSQWTLPIMTIPGVPVVDTGVYRYLRHPNWLGVILEIPSLPLIHGAYFTAIVFTIANAFLMKERIDSEEKALSETTNYADVFADKPRFIFKIPVAESPKINIPSNSG